MRILVVAPMEVEALNFKKALVSIPHSNIYNVVTTGVGKVNAAATTALELWSGPHAGSYDLVAVIGYAGGSLRLKQGDFVIPKVAKYHDVSCPADIVPDLSKEYELQGNDNICVLTGDTFVTEDNVSQVSSKNISCESSIFDMEAAAVCQVADDIPVLVMKLISDNPSSKDNLQSFEEFVRTHSNFAQFVYYLESLV